jgi:hypothetical protein
LLEELWELLLVCEPVSVCELLLACEPVSLWELVELLGFEAGASTEEGELTDDDLVALQATRFNPTTAQRNPRRAFLGRLNRIRTTLYKHLNIGPLPESTGPHAYFFVGIVKISSQ